MDSSTTRLRLGQNRANLNALCAGILLALFLAALSVAPALAAEQIVELYRGGQSQYVEPLTVAVNPNDGSCWLSINNSQQLVHLAADGTELWRGGEIWQTIGMMVNTSDNSLWVGDMLNDRVVHFAADGTVLSTTPGIDFPWGIAVNPTDGSCWVGANFGNEVIHLAQDGSVIRRVSGFNGPRDIAVNPLNGSCVVADFWNQQVVRLAADGTELGRINVQPITLASNPTDGSFWVANYSAVFHYAADGSELSRTSGFVIPDNISVCAYDGSCWVIDDAYDSLTRLDSAGNRSWEGAAGSFEDVSSISAGGPAGACWVVDTRDNEVILFSAGGQQLWSSTKGLYNPTSISARVVDSSCWVADSGNRQVVKMATDGTEQWRGGNFSDLTSVAANATDGSCWVTDRNGDVVHLSPGGAELSRTGGFSEPRSAAVNIADNSCWVADTYGNRIVQFNAAGTQINAFGGFNLPNSVAVNPNDGSFWVADYYHYQVAHLSASGVELRRISFTQPIAVAVDFEDGSCWVADTYEVVHLAADGTELSRTSGFLGPQSLAVDQTDNSVWVADSYHDQVAHLAPNGAEQSRAGGFRYPWGVSVNPADGSCWVADYFHHQVVRLTATGINYPPTASNSSVTVDINSSITGTLVASDPEGAPLVFGLITNGTLGAAEITDPASGAYTYTPNPNVSGADSFTFKANDGFADSNTGTISVNILANATPLAVPDSATTPEDTPVTIPVLANDSDADGNPLSVVSVAVPAHGSAVVNGDGTVTYTPNANWNGVETFTYTITDGITTATGNITVTVTPVNDPPIAVDDSAVVPMGLQDPATIAVMANDSDPDNEPTGVIALTQPAHGLAAININNTIGYLPDAGYSGPDSFTYTLGDVGGGTAIATVNITVTNEPPTAADDFFTVNEDNTGNIPVLVNDSDPEGCALTVSVTTPPSHGVATVNPDNTVAYTPAPDFNGRDSFGYTVTDSGGLTAGATVTVTINPVADARDVPYIAYQGGGFGGPWALAVNPNDNTVWVAEYSSARVTHLDANGGLIWRSTGGYSQPYAIAINPSDNTVWVADRGASTLKHLNSSGAVLWQGSGFIQIQGLAVNPNDSSVWLTEYGANRVRHLAANGSLIAQFTGVAGPWGIAVNPTDNTVWIAYAGAGQVTHLEANGTLIATFDFPAMPTALGLDPRDGSIWVGDYGSGRIYHADVNGNILSQVSGFYAQYAGSLSVNPVNGECWVGCSNTGSITRFAADGRQLWRGAGYATPYGVAANPNDGSCWVALYGAGQVVHLKLTNTPPTAQGASVTTHQDEVLSGTLTASDADGDPLTYLLVQDGSLGSVVITDAATGAFTYTPNPGVTGSDSFAFKVSDGLTESQVAWVSVEIRETNLDPVASDGAVSTAEDTPVSGLLSASDPNSDPLTFSIVSQGTLGAAEITDPASGAYTYTPNPNVSGADSFTFKANDSITDSNIATVSVTINPANDAPVASDDSATTDEDTAVVIDVLTNDSDPEGNPFNVTAVSPPTQGGVVINGDGTITFTPATNVNGHDYFTYTVTDSEGATATANVQVYVNPVNDPSNLVADTAWVYEDSWMSIPVLANDSDPDIGFLLLFELTQPAHGTAVIVGNKVQYTPAPDYNGTDSFTYTVAPGGDTGDTATATVTVNVIPVDDAPLRGIVDGWHGGGFSKPLSVSVNPTDSSVWVADNGNNRVIHLAADGTVLQTVTIMSGQAALSPSSLSVNTSDGSVWVAAGTSSLVHLSATGAELWRGSGYMYPGAVSVNPSDGSVWVADTGHSRVVHLSATGTILWQSSTFSYPDSVTVNPNDGSCWVADTRNNLVIHLASNGTQLWSGAFTYPKSIAVNTADNSVWVAGSGGAQVLHLAANGAELWRGGSFMSPASVSVNPTDGSVFVLDYGAYILVRLASNGAELWRVSGFSQPRQVAVNRVDGSAWVADFGGRRVWHFSASGSELWRGVGFKWPRGLSVNSTDGSVWVADDGNSRITHLAEDGSELFQYFGANRPEGVSVNSTNGSVWVASTMGDQVVHLAANGNQLWYGAFTRPQSVSVNTADGSCWVASTASTQVLHLAANGAELWRGGSFMSPASVSVNPTDGSVFVLDYGAYILVRLASNGAELWRVGGFSHPRSISANRVDGSVWVADAGGNRVWHFAADGTELWHGTFNNPIGISVNPTDGSCWVAETGNHQVVLLAANGAEIWRGGDFVSPYAVSANEADGSCWVTDFDNDRVVHLIADYDRSPIASDGAFATDEDIAYSGLLSATEPNGQPMTFSLVSQGTLGTATITNAATGAFSYTPNPNVSGADSFTFKANDGAFDSNVATVTVTINPVNDPPLAVDDSATTDEELPVTIDVLANDTDIEGEALTVSAVQQPESGQAALNPDGTITYTPNANFNGADSFAYTVIDGSGGSNIAGVTVTVNPVGDTPIADSDSATTYEEAATSIAVLANDRDPDGGALTITNVSPSANGTAVITGSSVRYTPNTGFNGADSFTYTVSNDSGLTATAAVTVTVIAVDDTPKLPTVSWSSNAYGYSYGLAVNPNDGSVWVTSPAFSNMVHLDANGNLIWRGGEFYAMPVSVAVNTADNSIWVGEASGRITHLSATGDILFRQQNFGGIWSVSVNPNDGSCWVADTAGGRVSHLAADGQQLWSAYLGTPYSVSVDPTDGSCWIAESGLNCVKHYSADHNLLGTVSGAGYPYSVSANPVDGSVWVAWISSGEISHLAADGTELWRGGGFNSPWSVSVNVTDGSCWVGDAGGNRVVHLSAAGALLQQATGMNYPVSVSVNPADGSCWAANMNNGEVVHITLVNNQPPIASNGNLNVLPDTPKVGALPALDPEGYPLTFSIVSQGTKGTVVIDNASSGAYTYTPNAGVWGADSFTFKANDGASDSNVAQVAVMIYAQPVAVDDAAFTDEDTQVTIDALANDYDPSGMHTLSLISIATQPAHGTAVIVQGQSAQDARIVYTPAPDFFGMDSFTYTSGLGSDLFATATVTVTVNAVNDPPNAVPDTAVTYEDNFVLINVLANDTDPEGYPISLIAVRDPPIHGAAFVEGNKIRYTPGADYFGAEYFSYTIRDSNGATSSALITVTVIDVDDTPFRVETSPSLVSFQGPFGVAANPNNGSCWVADYDNNQIDLLDAAGAGLWLSGGFYRARTISVNTADNSAWITEEQMGRVAHVSADGTRLYSAIGFNAPESVSVNPADGSIWVADTFNDRVVHLAADGTQLWQGAFVRPQAVSVNTSDGSVWVGGTSSTQIAHYAADGTELWRGGNFTGLISIAVNPTDGSVWIGDCSADRVTHLAADGAELWRSDILGVVKSVSVNPLDGSCWVADYSNNRVFLFAANGTQLACVTGFNGPTSVSIDYHHKVCWVADYGNRRVVRLILAPLSPPVAQDGAVTAAEDLMATGQLIATDPAGHPITFSIVTQGIKGTAVVTDPASGAFIYTPNANANGADSFTFKANDGADDSNIATITVTINPSNDGPVAVDDSATTNEDTSVTISVLTNDLDVDGDALTVSELQQPVNGQAVLNPDGTVTYTPNANFNGTDTFTYRRNDGYGNSNVAGVTITVNAVNDPPIAVDDNGTTNEETPISIQVTENDLDDHHWGAFPWVYIDSVTQPAHGAVTMDPPRLGIIYMPSPNFNGVDTFTYIATDGEFDSTATVTITVLPVNDPPTAVDDDATAYQNGPAVLVSPLGNDSDIDGDSLTIAGYSQPAHGVVNSDPSGLLYMPQAGYSGPDSFEYTIADGQGGSDTATVRIMVLEPYELQIGSAEAVPNATVTIPVTYHGPHGEQAAACVSNLRTLGMAETMYLVDHQGQYPPATTAAELQAALLEYVGDPSVFICPVTGRPYLPNPYLADKTERDVPDPNTMPMIWDDGNHPLGARYIVYADGHVDKDPASATRDISTISLRLTYNVGQPGVLTFTGVRLGSGLPSGWEITYQAQPGSNEVLATIHAPAGVSLLAADSANVVAFEFDFTVAGPAGLNPGDTCGLVPSDVSLLDQSNAPLLPVTGVNGAFTVAQFNRPPVATDDSVTTDEDTAAVVAVLANDSDADGDTLTVEVTQPTHGAAVVNGDGTVTYTPSANYNGADSFTYTVSDGNGGTATATVNITVTAVNDLPVAVNDDITTEEDVPVTFSVTANDSDADGDALTISGINQPAHGSAVLNADGTITYTPNANYNGADSFTYTVSDGNGGTATATVNIIVTSVNDLPVATDDLIAVAEDTSIVIDMPFLLSNDTDADGDTLVVSGHTQVAHGTLTDNPDGTLGYAPNANWSGDDSFDYTVSDGHGGAATATVTLRVMPFNDPPVAVDDVATTDEDTLVDINVLANDSDVEGDDIYCYQYTQPAHGTVANGPGRLLRYTPAANYNGPDSFTYSISDGKGASATATVTITVNPVNDPPAVAADSVTTDEDTAAVIAVLANDFDPEGGALTVSSITQPTHGAAAINPDGTVTYTPGANWFGADSFTYTASDGQGGATTASVSVTVTSVNDSPVAVDDSAATDEDAAVVIDLLANDTDVEGDQLAIVPGSGTLPAHGAVTLNPDGTVTYTPTSDWWGVDSFTYTVSDGQGGSAYATVTVTVNAVADPPTAAADSVTTDEDTAVDIAVLGNDSDPDGDPLTVTGLTQPANGAALLKADGTVTYTPNANYHGVDSFDYTISAGGATATATVTVTVNEVNDVPVAADDSASINEDNIVNLTVLDNDTDVDLDSLTVSAVTQPANGKTVITSGTNVRYTPNPNYNGTDTFTYTVSDGRGGAATATVTINIAPVNDAPKAVNDTAVTNEDTKVNISVLSNDSDPENDPLLIADFTQPTHGQVVLGAGGILGYIPATDYFGADSFTYKAQDSSGATSLAATVTITIAPLPDPPVAVNDEATVAEDTAAGVLIRPLLNDYDPDGASELLRVYDFQQPDHGQVIFHPSDPSRTLLIYIPEPNFSGADYFQYRAFDTTNRISALASVRVTVTPLPDPTTALDDSALTPEDTPVVILVLKNDFDVDGPLTISNVTDPPHGAAVIDPGQTSITYTPDSDFYGADSFFYTATDGQSSDTARVVVNVTAVSDPPEAQDDLATVAEDPVAALPINVLANDRDVDSPAFAITAITQPAHGTSFFTSGYVAYKPQQNYNGPDSFTYTISSNDGTDTATVNITVTPVNDPPVAVDDTAVTDEEVAVTIAVLANDYDVESSTLALSSATQPAHGAVVGNADGTVTYTPVANFAGADSFTYTIKDGPGGLLATATVTVTVNNVNDPPVATNDAAATAEDTATTISVLANDSDPDGDTLSVSDVTQPAHGTAVNAGGTVTYTPAANYHGADSFTYTVSDGHGGSATATVNITVAPVNDPPTAVNDTAVTDEEMAVTVAVLANDSDLDGDTVSLDLVTMPTNGTAVVNPDGTVTYTPNANYTGADSFTYRVSDGHGGTATGTVTVTVNNVNDPPTANADAATTAEDTTAVIAVLDNDSDPDGDALTVSGVTQPAHGAAVVNPDGTVTYTPAANYSGADSFTYTISDGNGGTATTAVNITVTPVNDAPIAVDGAAVCNEDGQVSAVFPAADPDGDLLAYQIVSPPTSGSVTILGNGFTYTPEADFSGTDSFTYQASDGVLGSFVATILITVNPANDAPTADAGGPYSLLSGQAITLDAAASSDPDEPYGDAIATYEWDLDNDGSYELSGATATLPVAWADLLGYLGSPVVGQAYPVTLQVTDSVGATATASTSITINNTAPLANCGGPYTITWGQGITLNASGSYDPDQAGGDAIQGYAWDLNGDGAADITDASPTHTVTWAQLVSLLSGTISIEHTYPISLLVVDSFGATGSAITSVMVANTPPVAAFSFAPTAPTTADTVNFTDSSTDLEGAIASWAWNFGDSGTSTSQNPSHLYAAPGTYTVTLTVTDAHGATGVMTHEVAVTQAGNTQPGSPVTVNPGSGVSVTFTNVTSGGDTTVTTSTNPPHGGPQGIKFNNTYYDISTNAGYTGTVTIAIAYDPAEVHGNEDSLKLFHSDGSGGWQNVTTYVDTVNHIIYGQVTSFSWFAIGWDTYDWLGFLPPISETGRPFKRGSTIPIKFRIARTGQPVPSAVATLEIFYLVNGVPSGDVQVVSTTGADTGNLFRYSAGDDLYIFNLNTKNGGFVGQYTYLARVTLDDGTTHEIQFSLK